jgi:AraC family transcriptional regulator of adaptative response/methylated-DNA-[protein]-cysteine methyltransferase
MNDFARVAKVIQFLDANRDRQPGLAEIAAVAGLSPSHVHRLFRRWAGVTPKDFLQCLTLEHAKRRLRESASVLEAALDAGLSGQGRLHDLLVSIEAASPGEYKNGGRGLSIEWGVAESPFGLCSLGWNSRGVCHLAFHEAGDSFAQPPRQHWPNARFRRDDREAGRRAGNIFHFDSRPPVTLKTFVRGTPFQLKVWRALIQVPKGCAISYGWLAKAVGHPGAARAVGAAVGANPVAYLIPCHRVIRETGIVGGYHWGATRKSALLAWESRSLLGGRSAATP